MKIYSMTATFGKLEHQTLTLEPGLNVIHAPNEWGKSTWCAFLVSMLYGIDTKVRTTQAALADKERYAPWSGSPMSGRIDLNWNGRDITIERRTKGRAIFGDFTAYETQTGLAIPDLTAANCGEMLLGVEKSVFTRAGFLRLTDLPVTDDDSLRRRLNALVTTGDESGASDALEQKLKDLKNRCRYNRSGLLPQAEAQRSEITGKLRQLQELQIQIQRTKARQSELDSQIKDLENHRAALAYEASLADARRVTEAKVACENAAGELEALNAQCAQLPSKEDAQASLTQLEQLQTQLAAFQAEALPPIPETPVIPPVFTGMDADQAVQQARSDKSAFDMLSRPLSPLPLILASAGVLIGAVLAFINWRFALPFPLLSIGLVLIQLRNRSAQKRDRQAIAARYRGLAPEEWFPLAQQYQHSTAVYTEKLAAYQTLSDDLNSRRKELTQTLDALTQGAPLSESLRYWRSVVTRHEALEQARLTWTQANDYANALSAMAKDVESPAFPDQLTYSKEETSRFLSDALDEQRQLQRRLGQYQGQMEALGQEQTLLQQLEAVQMRIDQLEDTYAALDIAMQTLAEAANDLQRKFAPRISQRAQTLFGKLTDGRYDRLSLGEDLRLSAGAQEEDTLRTSLWRSDGTADQLYFALRLAVAEELTPNAPLVLDDALVRFDNSRLALAMDILKEEAKHRQVILFTCQGRETSFV